MIFRWLVILPQSSFTDYFFSICKGQCGTKKLDISSLGPSGTVKKRRKENLQYPLSSDKETARCLSKNPTSGKLFSFHTYTTTIIATNMLLTSFYVLSTVFETSIGPQYRRHSILWKDKGFILMKKILMMSFGILTLKKSLC